MGMFHRRMTLVNEKKVSKIFLNTNSDSGFKGLKGILTAKKHNILHYGLPNKPLFNESALRPIHSISRDVRPSVTP